jgi:hypothetical protein
MHSLELQPFARSLARIVAPRRAFGDYAFFVGSLRLGELALTKLGDMLAVAKQGIARQKGFQSLLSFKQRLLPDIFTVHEQCIKRNV